MGKLDGDLGARQVVDLDGEEGEARPLVLEGEVESLVGRLHAPCLRVDDDLVVLGEPALVGGNPVDELVRLGLPRGRLSRRRVELVIEEAERLLALDGVARKQVAVPQAELDLDVDSIGAVSLQCKKGSIYKFRQYQFVLDSGRFLKAKASIQTRDVGFILQLMFIVPE